MNEQPINLRASLQELSRRRLLILMVAALLGIGGLAYGLLTPPDQTAIALVLLPSGAASGSSNSGNTGNSGTAGNDTTTQAVIARSTPVLAAAGAKVRPPLGALAVAKLVAVTPLSGQILQIQAKAPESGYAVQLANALAASYVDDVRTMEADSTRTAVAGLQQEATQLTTQIKNLQYEIVVLTARITSEGAGSSQGQQDSDQLTSLRNEQNQASLQLNNVTNQITSAQLADGSTGNGTRILQTATLQSTSKYLLPVEAGIIGFVLGMLGSAAFVLLRLQREREHRLRLRDEIARTAGAPVIASLEAPRCTNVSAWRDLLAGPRRATTEWSLRHVLHSLPIGRPRIVRVISFAGDSPALTTGPRLAQHAAASGMQTILWPEVGPESEDRSLKSLRAAFISAEPVNQGLPFTLESNDTNQDSPDCIVSIVVFNGNSSVLVPSDGVNLLSISANVVTDEELALLALQANDSGLVLDGVVVVNPDPTDNTTGRLKNDTVRRLPSRASADSSDHELVHLKGLTSEAGAWQERHFDRGT